MMSTQQGKRIHFIGAGNMASAMLRGLVSSGFSPALLSCSAPAETETQRLVDELGIRAAADNLELLTHCDAIVLGVKPQILKAVCEELAPFLASTNRQPLVISIAAGTTTQSIAEWLKQDPDLLPLVRSMPNTPAQVGMGASGLFATPAVKADQKSLVQQIFEAFGIAVWVEDESQLHAVTALSGSGPAYVFEFIKGMADAGVSLGLSPEVSRQLAEATVAGAAKLCAASSDEEISTLQRKVMSPGGTTEQGVRVLQSEQLTATVSRAMEAARDQSLYLAGEGPGPAKN
ncbi:pyrroline-5-carboxylate reductase [Allohahella marinimesophila]|uniref:Pyrroline-5-carboxylate reductase n=1 Tax=Allohahella marinimesophila TaxID=1054972 RepID=A0ABP7PBF7_9GAMM